MDIGQPFRQGEQGTHFRHFESASPDIPSTASQTTVTAVVTHFVDVDALELVEPLSGKAKAAVNL